MSAFSLTAESEDIARIFTNALAFFPARSPVKTALLRVGIDYAEAIGTDTFTIGRDYLVPHVVDFSQPFPKGSNPCVPVELDRDGWRDIESQARKDKGNTGRLEFTPGDCLIFYPGGSKAERGVAKDVTGEQTTVLVNGETFESKDVWTLVDELLVKLEHREPQVPHLLTFDPALFVRFNKVRTPANWEADKVLDFVYQGEGEPMLCKVGPTFVGAIMPVDRGKYAAKQGDEGQEALW